MPASYVRCVCPTSCGEVRVDPLKVFVCWYRKPHQILCSYRFTCPGCGVEFIKNLEHSLVKRLLDNGCPNAEMTHSPELDEPHGLLPLDPDYLIDLYLDLTAWDAGVELAE